MKINKTATLILFLAIALAVSGCGKKETPSPVANNNNNVQQVDSNVNENQGGQEGGAVEDGQSGEQGEVIKEENGWKKYVDKNLGIEFRFQDIADETKVNASGDWLCLEQISGDDSYIYIQSRNAVLEYYREKYTNLEDYLKYYYGLERGKGTKTELIEIEKITNSNNIELLKAGMLHIGFGPEDRSMGNEYYVEYNNKDFTYLSASYNPSYESLDKEMQYLQVINSLKFID